MYTINSVVGLVVPNDTITPPSAVIVDVGLLIGETVSAAILAGRTPGVVSPNIPVSSSGGGESGRIGVRQSRPTSERNVRTRKIPLITLAPIHAATFSLDSSLKRAERN
jgi:hypothetical protein